MTSGQGYRTEPTQRDRRRSRIGWIVTAVLAVLVVVAIVVAIVVHASGAGKTVVLEPGDTHFTKAGIAKMYKGADAQIDVVGARQASAVDLPANAKKTYGPFPGIAAELDLVGKHGNDSLFVDTFTVTTKNNNITSITTSTKEFDYTDLHEQLEAVGVIGISNKAMADFENAMPAGAGGPTSHFALTVGTGYDLGVPTKVAVKCAGAAGCTVTTATKLTTN